MLKELTSIYNDYEIITVKGTTLKAVAVKPDSNCDGCVFDKNDEIDGISCWDILNCINQNRTDETDIIWVNVSQ
jgi:hypothetical protein